MRQPEKRPLIGVTCGAREQNGQYRASLSMSYVDAVQAAGGVPILIPPMSVECLKGLLPRVDGLLLTGGGDIAPEVYGEPRARQVMNVQPERDETELIMTRVALENKLPVLGVCRGLQVINVASGGNLIQDIPSNQRRGELAIAHQQRAARHQPTHVVTLEPKSRLASIAGASELSVNSFHHQAVKELGEGLRAIGWSDDGLVEAIEGQGPDFLIGVQWHPEELVERDSAAFELFRTFVEEAGAAQGRARSLKWPTEPLVTRAPIPEPAPTRAEGSRGSGRRSGESGGSFRLR